MVESIKAKADLLKYIKNSSVGWLRRERDGVIGYIKQEINNLENAIKTSDETEIKNLKQKIDHIQDVINELTELNDQIYDIEFRIDDYLTQEEFDGFKRFKYISPHEPKINQ